MEFKLIFRKQTPAVPFINNLGKFIKENQQLITDFHTFCLTQDRALGYAINQLNVDGVRSKLRICAIRDYPENTWKVIFNPQILEYLGKSEFKLEGCLTWPQNNVKVIRYNRVLVTYYDEKGEFVNKILGGVEAQIFQHEVDHLNGVKEELVEADYKLPAPPKLTGRNDPCPCGNPNKKYKQCCLNKA